MKLPKYYKVDSSIGFQCEMAAPKSELATVLSNQTNVIKLNVTYGKAVTPFSDFHSGFVLFSNCAHKQLMRGDASLPPHVAVSFNEVRARAIKHIGNMDYHILVPQRLLSASKQSVVIQSGKWKNATEQVLIPEADYPSHWIYKSKSESDLIYCDQRFVNFARFNNWDGLCFRPMDMGSLENSIDWSIDYLGPKWPPQWWPDGYEPHPSNVIEGEVPDIKVGEGLPEGVQEPVAKPKRKRSRPVDPSGRLISIADVLKLRLRDDDEGMGWAAEVPLNRSLFGSDTLEVAVVIEISETPPKRSLVKETVQGMLNLLERLLPDIEAGIRKEIKSYGDEETQKTAWDNLHSPSLMFIAEELAPPSAGLLWSKATRSLSM